MNLKLLHYTALLCVWEYNSQSPEFFLWGTKGLSIKT